MKTKDVKKLSPEDRFFYWISERHRIYRKREKGEPKPWTDDEVLQSFFFTNPYRENDRVTKWFRENIREPLRDDPAVLMATVIFRWFNLPETGNYLAELSWTRHRGNLLLYWDKKEALTRLGEARKRKEKIFTGAFMINSPPGIPKLEAICERIDNVRKGIMVEGECGRGLNWWTFWKDHPTLEAAHGMLTKYDGLGGFMAYEIVCDLRYTFLLENATDIMTWCNPGPGCIRGLYRILGKEWDGKGNNASAPPKPSNWLETMKHLLDKANLLREDKYSKLFRFPAFEMREIEHSLCEYDKYSRALEGDGKMKRRYPGV